MGCPMLQQVEDVDCMVSCPASSNKATTVGKLSTHDAGNEATYVFANQRLEIAGVANLDTHISRDMCGIRMEPLHLSQSPIAGKFMVWHQQTCPDLECVAKHDEIMMIWRLNTPAS